MKINDLDKKELIKLNKWNENTFKLLENNYPVQYIIGYVDFHGLKINVNESTLIPRYETEYLIELTLKKIKELNITPNNILDLCTGSGAIGLTLKHKMPSSNLTLSDISSSALKVATQNKSELNLNVNIIESDMLKNITGKFDIIISNPPYVMTTESLPKDVLYEPHLALYSGLLGTDHIEELFKTVHPHLESKYLIALEINEQSEYTLTKLIKKYFNNINYTFEKDLSGKTRYLFISNV